jgi:hypothetical protein
MMKTSKSVARPDPGFITNVSGLRKIELLLFNYAGIMFAKINNAGRIARRPFEPEWRLFIAEFKILLFPTMRAGNMEAQKCSDSLAARSIWQVPLILGVDPRIDLGQTDPSIRLSPESWRALFLNILVKGRQLVITRHIDGFFTVVFCSFTTEAPETAPIRETLHTERVVPVLLPYQGASDSSEGYPGLSVQHGTS